MRIILRNWAFTIFLLIISSTAINIIKTDSNPLLNNTDNFGISENEIYHEAPFYFKNVVESTEGLEEYLIEKAKEEKEASSKNLMYVWDHSLFYSYMYGTAVTNTESKQYKLISQSYVSDYGILAVDGHYLVAMGTFYADYVGRKYEITFANGNSIKVMIGDIKQDRHTYNLNRATGWRNNDIIEFIINPNYTLEYVLKAGSFHVIEDFNAPVVAIKKID